MTDAAKVLDLDAVFDRPVVKLGGKEYELRTQQEFSILEWHQIVRMDAEAVTLTKRSATNLDSAKRLSQKQRDLAAMLIVGGLPEGIDDWACAAIIRFWSRLVSEAVGADDEGDEGNPRKPRRSTTAGSSRGSKRSTAATRKTGSTSRRTR